MAHAIGGHLVGSAPIGSRRGRHFAASGEGERLFMKAIHLCGYGVGLARRGAGVTRVSPVQQVLRPRATARRSRSLGAGKRTSTTPLVGALAGGLPPVRPNALFVQENGLRTYGFRRAKVRVARSLPE